MGHPQPGGVVGPSVPSDPVVQRDRNHCSPLPLRTPFVKLHLYGSATDFSQGILIDRPKLRNLELSKTKKNELTIRIVNPL